MTPTTDPAAPPRRRPKRHMVLSDVPWVTYARMVKAFEHKPGVRLAFDRGELEIMAPSFEHEKDAAVLAHLVELLTEAFGLPITRGGSVTVKRKKVRKGIEPDKCFWVANAAALAGVRALDLRIHPPPDLAIEVDVWHSSLDRFGIYARLGTPELWRLNGDELKFYQLDTQGKYVEVPTTPTFSGITPAELMQFVRQFRAAADENLVTRVVRDWLRHQVATPFPPPVAP